MLRYQVTWLHGYLVSCSNHGLNIGTIFKADSDWLILDPEFYWISTLVFELNIEFEYCHFVLMPKKYVNIDLMGSIPSTQISHVISLLSQNVNVPIQCWAETFLFNFEGVKSCQNQPLGHRSWSSRSFVLQSEYGPVIQMPSRIWLPD